MHGELDDLLLRLSELNRRLDRLQEKLSGTEYAGIKAMAERKVRDRLHEERADLWFKPARHVGAR